MSDELGVVKILDGNTFVVSDDRGDVEATPSSPTGLFALDTRFLSRWVLTIDGQRLNSLSVDDLNYFETRFFLVPGEAAYYVDAKVSVIRERSIVGSFAETLTVLNHAEVPVDLEIRIEAGSDFADLFEIKDEAIDKKGDYYAEVQDGHLRMGYQRGTFRRETVVSTTEPATVEVGGLTFTVHIPANDKWTAEIHVKSLAVGPGGRDLRMGLRAGGARGRDQMQRELEEWIESAPSLNCESEPLQTAYRRSLVDLAALRYSPIALPGQYLPAAGLPWFMTMFGRDSVFTSLQTLPFVPSLSATTLRILAALQGTRIDDFRDEDPGRILHEFRYGETAAFEDQPHSPYFGTVDATPLFVILLDEYERWSGDTALVHELEKETRAALNWMYEYADLAGNGYLWYERRNLKNGLENQCWKDSWDSLSYSDGRLPGYPRATCESQGYMYDAKVRAARLARLVWNDPAFADRLEAEAAALKERFNRDFWVEEGEYYALGIDPDGGQYDVLTSNIGHLLWSGIVDAARAPKIAEHLVGPRLYSGWGVRTMAVGEARYNPIGYHVGTIWPFDNSFIAWGLRRYGFVEESAMVADGMIDAAEFFQGRLPEAFGGYDRELTKYPVQYPTACSPQAWSTGTPMLLLRTMLGLEPHEGHLAVEPALPEDMGRIELLDIPGRWGRVDAFARGRIEVRKKVFSTAELT
ncbi:MAG TPA: glycogen debranching N-terminal domain-containing protein [Micromonosporaceae bacterium]